MIACSLARPLDAAGAAGDVGDRRTDARWERIGDLFDRALVLPERDRAAWLADVCGDDTTLRAEVEGMLRAHERTGGILDRAPVAVVESATSIEEHLASAISDRYTIERELGRGGMAIVYLAHERKHARRVVIKVLRPDVGASCGVPRFVREVEIAASLAHPHIVGLIDSGEADGLLYYVMPYLEGETLRARLTRGPLALRESVAMLRDVADALAHAHRAGVVHRDLKPENVFCAGHHAFLLDFGIAKFGRRPSGNVRLTQHGAAIGTPAYMAPEQREGSPRLDHRADLFAWGLLAHEMLTGALPGVGYAPSDHGDTLDRHPELPPPLVRLVRSCIAPRSADRPESAEQLVATLDALDVEISSEGSIAPVGTPRLLAMHARRAPRRRRWLVAAALAVVSAAVAVGAIRGAGLLDRGTALGPIAVAAFTNETGDPSFDAWGRMAGDWITQGLQEADVIPVVAWPSALVTSERLRGEHAAGRAVDPVRFFREETGAGALVTGAVYRTGDSLRFHVELTAARGARPLGTLAPVVVPRDSGQLALRLLRDRLMGAVAYLADDRVAKTRDAANQPPTFDSYRAFDHALQRFLAQEYGDAAPEFREAQALDSTFLVPLLFAATAYWNTGQLAEADTMLRVLRSHRASLADCLRAWADFLEAMLVSDGPRALESIRRAASLQPQSRASYDLAQLLLDMDQPQEALAALERLNPDRGEMRGWSSYWTQLAHARHLLGTHDAELADVRAMRSRFPTRRVGMVLEARALGALGRDAALDTLLAASQSLSPSTYWSQGAALVVAGEELVVHGHPVAGRRRLEQAIVWLRAQLAVEPTSRAHREWLASALYDLQRWSEVAPVIDGLRREFPDRLKYRGLSALVAARLGRPGADSLLGVAAPNEQGTLVAYRARLAAVRGDPVRAAALFAEATRLGVGSLPWLHGEAAVDLRGLGRVRETLPFTLRSAVPRR